MLLSLNTERYIQSEEKKKVQTNHIEF